MALSKQEVKYERMLSKVNFQPKKNRKRKLDENKTNQNKQAKKKTNPKQLKP